MCGRRNELSPSPAANGNNKKGDALPFFQDGRSFSAVGKEGRVFFRLQFFFLLFMPDADSSPPDKFRMHCIIPLKARSMRCPGKNFRTCNPYLSGDLIPLWEVSARYVRGEGWEPVISCDSPELLHDISRRGYERTVLWHPDPESPYMQGHISQVAAQINAGDSDLLCVVQATSPVRRPGLLRDMHALMSSDTNIQVAFTGERLKICGILNGSLFGQDESQSARHWYDHYDGALLLLRYDTLKRCPPRTVVHPGLLSGPGDKVAVFYQTLPWSFQIDTEDDYSFYLQMRRPDAEKKSASCKRSNPYRVYTKSVAPDELA
jgi:hypothetical protein